MLRIGFYLFDDFEALDLFGPVEVFGRMPAAYSLEYLSLAGGLVRGAQGFHIETRRAGDRPPPEILLVPGGMGTRRAVLDAELLRSLTALAEAAKDVLAICTGSALLAQAGLLRGKRATSNKAAFAWVRERDPEVLWQTRARWVFDGKYASSSGVAAGIDLSLAFIAARQGKGVAERICAEIEYVWNDDPALDPFAIEDSPGPSPARPKGKPN